MVLLVNDVAVVAAAVVAAAVVVVVAVVFFSRWPWDSRASTTTHERHAPMMKQKSGSVDFKHNKKIP